MTGAPLPDGADAVVKQEVVTLDSGRAVFSAPVDPWTAVNRAGEEIEPGRVLVEAGTRLTPPSVGLLAAMGVGSIKACARPRVSVISTGDELVCPGEQRGHGKIFDSVSPMLASALKVWGAGEVKLCRCRDDEQTLSAQLESSLVDSDLVLAVGGVSVGDYDFTVPAMLGTGIGRIFHGISQKPGKPLFFGVDESGRCAFGLPGNPASALVCAAVYVRTALELMAGVGEPAPETSCAIAGAELVNRTGRTRFLRVTVRINASGVRVCVPAGGQGSYMLSSFAVSDALAELPPEPVTTGRGERVDIYPLGWS